MESANRREVLRQGFTAALVELANDVGASAACQALDMPRPSYYRYRRKTSFPAVTVSRLTS